MASTIRAVTVIEVTRTYVQLQHPEDLRPADRADPTVRVERADPCPAGLYRFLYGEVGVRYHWVDRRDWTDTQIDDHLGQSGISIWVLRVEEAIAGFFELSRHPDGSTEIVYFGLLHAYLGRGLGRHMLTVAVQRAWETGANRVWLHTCTLDHPSALPNYLARGFTKFKSETYTVERG